VSTSTKALEGLFLYQWLATRDTTQGNNLKFLYLAEKFHDPKVVILVTFIVVSCTVRCIKVCCRLR